MVHFHAQAAHRNLHHIGFAVEIHVPHLRCQLRAGEHLALAPKQQGQQVEFLGCEVQSGASARSLAADQI
ncbi:hypothetical protein D3C71_1991650 [compost metagenome]